MSYSRWSSSRWYSYWDAGSLDHIKSDEYVSDIDRRDLQSLVVWDSKTEEYNFLYGDLVKSPSLGKLQKQTKCSDDELKEVQKIVKRFIQDVKEDFRGSH
jgi:hypothetical protein